MNTVSSVWQFFRIAGVVLILPSVLAGCMASHTQKQSVVRDDPLIGSVVDTANGERISFGELIARAMNSDVVYLAEKHDNAEHHAQQLKVIEALIERGVKPVLGFEFFSVGETGLLTQYALGKASTMKLKAASQKTPEQRLRRNLGWEQQSDEYWGYYFELIELARKHALDIFGADLSAGIKTRISRGGLQALNAVEQSELRDSGFKDQAYQELMYQAFREGHCGWGEEALLQRLYETWIARNDRMAASIVEMAKAAPSGPVVVILGNGHVRNSMGVYERVAHLDSGLKQLNLGFREITVKPSTLSDYLAVETVAGKTFEPIHQLLWFTQRQDYEDPCQMFHSPKK